MKIITGRARTAAALAAAIAITTAVTIAPPSATAASPGINKVLDAGKQTGRNVDGTWPSGRNVVYTVAVSCFDDGGDPTCAGFTLTDPPPTYTDVDGNPAAMNFVSANAGATQLSVSAGPTITFNTPLNAGQSVNVDLVYQIPAWTTPDNTTFTNIATWGPAGNAVASGPVDVTARARAAWTTNKTGPGTVTINTDATYNVQLCATNPNNPQFGPLRATLAGASLVDTLPNPPAGLDLVVVNAGGGIHDPAAGPNGTITWDLGDLNLAGGCATRQTTLRFETASPLASNVNVTNTVQASGTPSTAEFDFNTTANLAITVRNPLPGNPQVTKAATRSVIDMDHTDGENDSEFSWRVRPRNTGQGVVADFTLTDNFNQHFELQSARPGTWPTGPTGPDGDNVVRFTFTRDSGATVVHTANGVVNPTWSFPDIGDPVISAVVEYGDVPASWNQSNTNQVTFTGIAINPGRNGGTWDLVAARTAILPNTATLTGDTVDALGNTASVVRNVTANVTVVAPQPAPTISKSASVVAGPTFSGAAYPTSTIRWTITATNPAATATGPMIDPSFYDLIPDLTGPGLGAPTNFTVTAPGSLTLDDPLTQNVTSTTGTIGSEQLLVWDFVGDFRPGQTIVLRFDTIVLDFTPPQTATNRSWIGTNAMNETIGEWYSTFNTGAGTWETDTLDLDGDSNTTERVRRSNASMNILDFVVATSEKLVSGPELDPGDPCSVLPSGDDNETFGDGRCTRAGDRIDYELTVANEGNVGLEDLVLIDMFPMPGDTLVLPNQSNGSVGGRGPGGVGSDFAPNLTGPVTSSDPNVSVEYTTVANPCRGADFYPQIPAATGWPSGCSPADWTTTLPVPITSVRAIRVKYDTTLAVNDSFTFTWPMRAPVSAQPGDLAYNAFAWAASSADSAAINQSAPPVVVVEVNSEPKPWLLGDRVWIDHNYDGVQNLTESSGLAGVPFAVFFDNDNSGDFTPGVDTLVASTVTDTGANLGEYLFNDLVDGRYFVLAGAPRSWVTSSRNAGANPAADSNFAPLGRMGFDFVAADLDGWDPSAIDPAEFSWVWISNPVVIAGDNDLTVDLGLWRPAPSLTVEKYTNTFDADLAPGVYLPVGQTVVWSYEVTNTGNTTLTDLQLVDTTTIGAPVAVTVTCNNTTLAAGASTDCFGSVLPAAVAGSYGNVVDASALPVLPPIDWAADTYDRLVNLDGTDFYVDGDPLQGPVRVTDSDPSHYYGAAPDIELVKTINGDDADTAPGVFIPAGGDVDWLFEVTNTGNVDLVITELTDDQLGTFDAGNPCQTGTLTFPVTLSPAASRTCGFTAAAELFQHVNNAVVEGLPVDDNGDPIRNFDVTGTPDGTTMDPVVDTDPAHYYGYAVPGIDIEKATSGFSTIGNPVAPADADTAPGPTLGAGLPVTWHYEITNTGNVDLNVTSFTDDQIGVIDTTTLACETGTASFPLVLAVGETVTCTLSGIASIGAYENIADVTGIALDDTGTPIVTQLTPASPTIPVVVAPVTDDDPSHYTGASAADLVVVKETSGESWELATGVFATTAPSDGVQLTAGGAVTWHYTVTNGGSVDLVDFVLVDDHGTITTADDMTVEVTPLSTLDLTGVTAGAVTFAGDTGSDGVLSVGETWTFTITSTSELGVYSNTVEVSAQPVDVNGDPVVDGAGTTVPRIDDNDNSSYVATPEPSVVLEKATNGEDADTGPGPYIRAGDVVTWTFDVTNTGGTALVDVAVSDPALDADDPVCTFALILPGATLSCDVTGARFGVGAQTNLAEVTALPAAPTSPVDPTDTATWPTDRTDYVIFTEAGDDVAPVTDDDPSHHFGANPAVSIEKRTNGEDPNATSDLHIPVGQTVVWTFEVRNTGNTPLADIAVTDQVPPATPVAVTCPADVLAPGASMTCEATGTATAGDHTNVATVVGQPVDPDDTPVGDPVDDTDESHYFGADPDIELVKTINGDDAETAPGVFIAVGDDVDWVFTVTNTGNVALAVTELTDDQLGTFDAANPCPSGTLTFPTTMAPAASLTCELTAAADLYQHVNNADVEGLPVDGDGDEIRNFDSSGDPDGTTMDPVDDADRAHYYGYATPAIDIEKATSGTAPDGTPVAPIDADTPAGPALLAGTEVTWHYEITNTGNVDLAIAELVDDVIGTIDDVDLSCDGGDATFPLVLAPGAAVTCTVVGIVQLDDYANIGSVVGIPVDDVGDPIVEQLTPASPTALVAVDPVSDADPSHYTGLGGPLVSVEKTTSGTSWNNASGEYAPVGPADGIQLSAPGEVVWHYEVSNLGDVDLAFVVLHDDHGTAAIGDDMTLTVVSTGPTTGTVIPTGVSLDDVTFTGDVGSDGVLSVGETWNFTITSTSELGEYANNVEVSGQPVDVNGEVIVDGTGAAVPRVDDTDDSSYHATALPSIDLEKATNGEDADTGPGPYVRFGDVVTWTFDVTNTGGTALVDVVVSDPDLDADDPVCTFELLLPGETVTCDVTGDRFGAGAQTNTANVSGLPAAPTSPVDALDVSTWPVDRADYVVFTEADVDVAPVTDDDPSHHFGSDPAVTIDKRTNGADAASPTTAVVVAPGSEVTWTFEVTNTGNTPLADIVVTDTVAPAAPVVVSCPTDELAPGESTVCTAVGVAGSEDHANTGRVVAQPVDPDGTPVGDTVEDSDVSHYRPAVADLEVSKYISSGADAAGVVNSENLTWTIEVTNLGPDTAHGLVLVDSLPGELTYVDHAGDWDCAPVADRLECAYDGVLGVGDTLTMTIATAVDSNATTVTNTVEVTSASIDTRTSNNASAATVVTPPPAPPTTVPPASARDLPRTGSDLVGAPMTSAAALMLAGLALWAASKTRRPATRRPQ